MSPKKKKKLNLPKGISEDDFVNIVADIAKKLSYKFRFGYFDNLDITQESYVFALDALDRYDSSRPLPNFLYVHIRNRLMNLKRNNYTRINPPCDTCPLGAYIKCNDECTEYNDKMECGFYSSWFNRNTARKNLITPINLDGVNDDGENNMKVHDDIGDMLDRKYIISILDANMPHHVRRDYLKMKHDVTIPKERIRIVINMAHSILKEHGIDAEEAWPSD